MKPFNRLLLVSGLLLLGGCSEPDFSDLQVYVDDVKARPKGKIEPVPNPAVYEAFTYDAAALRSPFLPPEQVELAMHRRNMSGVKPDLERPKQFLEDFDIDDFRMVGSLESREGLFALVRNGEGVYRVKTGDYLGRNHGRIKLIGQDRIELVEIVPDGEGGWLERPRTLLLQSRS